MVFVIAVLLGAGVGRSAIFITDIERWDTVNGWQASRLQGSGSPGDPTSVSPSQPHDGNALQSNQGTVDQFTTDRIFADGGASGGAFAAALGLDYTLSPASTVVGFDFFGSEDISPDGLSMYFTSTNSAGYWLYTFSGILGNTWQSFDAPISSSSDGSWLGVGTSTTFAQAITAINQIGIQITYTGEGGELYQFDNFRRGYMVPEPGTYAALGFALSSLGLTFRRRLNGTVDRIKTMLKA